MADLKRINRMVGILGMIDRRQRVTAKGLAEHFGASERSIYRDLKALIVDFPILFDEEKGSYRFVDGYSLKKVELSANEIRAVLVSKAAVAKLGKGVANAYDGLMKKLKTETGCRTEEGYQSITPNYWFDVDPVADSCKAQKQFDAVQRALDEKNSIEITYKAMSSRQVTERTINPYGLFCSGGVWYTLAYCRLKKDIREFALDCIQDIRPTDKYYAIPMTFSMDDYFKAGWHIIASGEPEELTLWFSKDAARYITRRKWHPTQKIETRPDGSIEFRVTLASREEIWRWVYSWGTNCEVLAPADFRKEVAVDLAAMAERYR